MARIQLRRGNASDWTTANSVLAAGEVGLEMDTGKFKWGDGTTAWNDLDYIWSPTGWVPNANGDGSLRLICTGDGPGIQITGGSASAIFQTDAAIAQFVAQDAGLAGEAISVLLQGLTDDEDLSIDVDGNAITVTLETSGGDFVSTAQNIADAIAADDDAAALVSVTVVNDGVINGQALQNLALAEGFTVNPDGSLNMRTADGSLTINMLQPSSPAFLVGSETDEGLDLVRFGTAAAGSWGINHDGLEYFSAFDGGAPDEDVGGSQRVQWFDDTSGAPKLKFKHADVDGTITEGHSVGISDDGVIKLPNLPTSDPSVADELWNDAGVLKVSAG